MWFLSGVLRCQHLCAMFFLRLNIMAQGKDPYRQAWRPEFHPRIPQWKEGTDPGELPSAFCTCAVKCTPPPSHTWWGLLNAFGGTLILALLYLLLKAPSSHSGLQTHLTSEGGQIPGKSDGLINGNAEAVGASVIGAAWMWNWMESRDAKWDNWTVSWTGI